MANRKYSLTLEPIVIEIDEVVLKHVRDNDDNELWERISDSGLMRLKLDDCAQDAVVEVDFTDITPADLNPE